MSEHSDLPWTWHAKSIDQAHNGSIYRMERPGHAYAIAMQPRYVDDAQFKANAELIIKAVNNHEALVAALRGLDVLLDFGDDDLQNTWTFDDLSAIKAAFEAARLVLTDVGGARE